MRQWFCGAISSVSTLLLFGNIKLPTLKSSNKKAQEKDTCAGGDDNKMIVVYSLQWLVQSELVKIYGYVIMPNHTHLLWEQLKRDGKEFPKSGFEKFTAKTFINNMNASDDPALKIYP